MHSLLTLILLYLFAAAAGVALCRALRLPSVMGYLLTGIVIGPHALNLAQNESGVEKLAEFGMVFLMFAIGLEFSLAKLKKLRHFAFGLGSAQLLGTMALVWAACFACVHFSLLKITHSGALALGLALAMSSTAIAGALLQERDELESPHGRRVLAVLLFQDLAVVPALVLIPALNAPLQSALQTLLFATLKALLLLLLLLVFGARLMRWWLTRAARFKNADLFTLSLLVACLGLAWLTDFAGLSPALGAFLAGALISETEFRHQVETDIRPFRDVLLGLFFVTLGSRLDWGYVVNFWWVAALTMLGILLGKLLLTILLARRTEETEERTALMTGLYLAPAGEFGLVLLDVAHRAHLFTHTLFYLMLTAMLLTLLLAPLLVAAGTKLGTRLSGGEWLKQSLRLMRSARDSLGEHDHVLLCGYGRCGEEVARRLKAAGIPFVALDLDPYRVRRGGPNGAQVIFGDATQTASLLAAGLSRARALISTCRDDAQATRILRAAHAHRPDLPVLVRTLDESSGARLRQAGACEAAPEVTDVAATLAAHALAFCGVPLQQGIEFSEAAREARYPLLRRPMQGMNTYLLALLIRKTSAVASHPLSHFLPVWPDLQLLGVSRHGQMLKAAEAQPLRVGDWIFLAGSAASLREAEQKLMGGGLRQTG